MRFSFLILFFISIMTLCGAEACECANFVSKNTADAVSYSTAVFTGRVSSIRYISDTDYVANFIVYDSWKGVSFKNFVVLSTISDKDCGFRFKTGEEYLVYSFAPSFITSSMQRKQAQKMMITSVSQCTRTKPLALMKKEEFDLLGNKIFSSGLKSYF